MLTCAAPRLAGDSGFKCLMGSGNGYITNGRCIMLGRTTLLKWSQLGMMR